MKAHPYLGYRLFKESMRVTHDTLLVRHRYVVGRERLPGDGERYFIVSNHENTANDPLNIIFALPRHLFVSSMARANMFEVNRHLTAFFHFLGMLPAYRLGWEGYDSLEKNYAVFDELSRRVNSGNPAIVFPSAGHSQGHYLLSFTTGVVHMALQAIEDNGWQHDVKIVPTALFYADYKAVWSDVEWVIGNPVSLLPYREMYEQHPYTVMRKVRDELRRQIEDMMLDEGREDYDAVDFLRNAFSPGSAPGITLPERLAMDKAFVASLRGSGHYRMLVALAGRIMRHERALGVSDANVARPMPVVAMVVSALALLVLLPLWIVSLWPHGICYSLPVLLLKEDKMFTNSYRYIISAVLLYPLSAIITIAVFAAAGWWWAGVAWVALWIPSGIFCWNYWCRLRRLTDNIKMCMKRRATAKIRQLREWARQLLP